MADISGWHEIRNPDNAGIRRRVIVEYTGPAAYPAGGDPYSAADNGPGIGVLEFVPGMVASDGTTLYNVWWDKANGTLRWFVSSTGLEVATDFDLSGMGCWVEAVGK